MRVQADVSCQPEYIDLEALPLTIRDTFRLLQSIGENYLWVDSICICQSDGQDKHEIISQMAAIYENAFLTVIAASGENADAGLARLRSNHNPSEQPTMIRHHGSSISLLPPRRVMMEILRETKWYSRAWTFQEWLMSNRCVLFTENEVMFYGSGFEAREAYELIRVVEPEKRRQKMTPQRFLNLHHRMVENKPMTFNVFSEVVTRYSKRKLSYPGDRLDAFLGILDCFIPPNASFDTRSSLQWHAHTLVLKTFHLGLSMGNHTACPAS